MNDAKCVFSLVMLFYCLQSAATAAPAEQFDPSPVAPDDLPDITRTIDASQYFRPFPDLVAYRNTSIQKAPAPVLAELSERELGKAKITKCWLNLDEMWDYRTRQYDYNYRIGVHKYDEIPQKHRETWGSVSETRVHFYDYLRAFGEHSDAVMLTIRRYERDILDGKIGVTMEDWKTIFKNAVKHYKQICPNLRYIEVCNEYALKGFIGCTADEYYQFYRLAYQAVNEVNAELRLTGEDRLLVGGPVVTGTVTKILEKLNLFIKNFAKDSSPNKKLDFVSWHEYHNDYAATAHREEQVRGMMALHGLTEELPFFITEHDPYHPKAGSREYNLINGAGLVKSLYFTSLHSPRIKIMPWVQYHIAEIQTRFMWFDGPNEPDTKAEELHMLPSGCSMKFLSMHKDWEIAVENAIANDHIVLASVQNDGLVVQAVNYGEPQSVRLRIEKLPKVFSALGNGKVRVLKYLIDQDHGNCVADPDYPGGIEKVEDRLVEPENGAITLAHSQFSKNGILLWELIPPAPGAVLNSPVSLAPPAPKPKQPPSDPAKAMDTTVATPRGTRRMRRPNILLVLTDQLFAEAMRCAGNPYVKTPVIDSLAECGMMFTEAYATSPVCSPSRGSMLTGLFPHQHGVTENGKRIKADLKEICIEHLLAAKGYECVYAGKWHLAASRTINKVGLKQHPYRVIADANDARVSEACAQYFGEKHGRPFFLFASYVNPHDICLWAMGNRDGFQRYPVPEIPLDQCPPLPGNYGVPEDEPTVLREFYMTRHFEQKSFNGEKWRRYLHAYYWMVEAVDAEIGKLLDALRFNGLEKDTLVVFTSDHGDGLAAHQWLGKCCHYDEAIRVPLIVSFPGVIDPRRVDRTHLISNGPDFYATALDYAGVAIPAGCQGRSLRRLLEGTAGSDTWRDQVVSEIWIPGGADPTPGHPWKSAWGRVLRTARCKYTIYDRGKHREQLHDLQKDRGEMHNLAADSAYREVLNEHRRRLAVWCKETRDVASVPYLISP